MMPDIIHYTKTVTRTCQIYLGLRDDITWCRDVDEKLCESFMEYVMAQGNFGSKSGYNSHSMDVGRQDDTELGHLMHDFHCRDASDIHSEILARRVYELKETQEGVGIMCSEMDKIYHEGALEGEMKAKKETAINMKKKGYPDSAIADLLEVGLNIVQQWVSGAMSLAK